MKKIIGGVLGAAALAVTAFFVIPSIPQEGLMPGNYRIAIANQACPEPGEQGYNYLSSKCHKWITKGNWCACVTHDPDPLTGEVDVNTLPDNLFRRAAICEKPSGKRELVFGSVGQTPPPSWTCVLIANKILWRQSYKAAKSKLVNKLREKCCANCTDDCATRPGSWGICPYCLLDGPGACDSLCREE